MTRRDKERWIGRIFGAIGGLSIAAVMLIFAFVAKEAFLLIAGGSDHGVDPSDVFEPRVWRGYEDPVFVWQPIGVTPKFNIVPLLFGSLKITCMTLLWSVPIAVGSAVYVSQYASRTAQSVIKPLMEFLAGIPSVVLGFFSLVTFATWVQAAFGCTYRLNALTASLAVSLAVIPIVFTLSEDALRGVSRDLSDAALSLGARRWQTVFFVIAPAAWPGIVAAVLLGFGRAVGETMIVLMASGNAPVLGLSPCAGARTATATLAAELGEVVEGSTHWRALFLLGFLLFLTTVLLGRLSRSLAKASRDRASASKTEAAS